MHLRCPRCGRDVRLRRRARAEDPALCPSCGMVVPRPAEVAVGPAFFERHCRKHPMRPGYELRKLYYWLHTLMLHIWLGVGEDNERRIAETAQRLVAAI